MYIQPYQALEVEGRAQKTIGYKAFIILAVGRVIHTQVKHQHSSTWIRVEWMQQKMIAVHI